MPTLSDYEVVIENSQGQWRYVVHTGTGPMAIKKAKDLAREDGWNGYHLTIEARRM